MFSRFVETDENSITVIPALKIRDKTMGKLFLFTGFEFVPVGTVADKLNALAASVKKRNKDAATKPFAWLGREICKLDTNYKVDQGK